MDQLLILRQLATRRAAAHTEVAAIDEEIAAAVRGADAAGISTARIAEALGLTRARVYQIKKGTR